MSVNLDFDIHDYCKNKHKSNAGSLSKKYLKKANVVSPSLRQVINGLMYYHIQKLNEKTEKLGHLSISAQKQLIKEYKKVFQNILNLVQISDVDAPLMMKVKQTTRGGTIFLKEGLSDPDCATT